LQTGSHITQQFFKQNQSSLRYLIRCFCLTNFSISGLVAVVINVQADPGGRLVAGIAGSIPAGGMDVSVYMLFCPV
jgi:hypothetical protein